MSDDTLRKWQDAVRFAAAQVDEVQKTHSAECYRWHHQCAIAEIQRLRAALAEEQEAMSIEPVAWLCPVDDGDGPDISCNKEYAEMFKGKAAPLYPASVLAAARREALEEAEKVCISVNAMNYLERGHAKRCAAAIRALIEKPD